MARTYASGKQPFAALSEFAALQSFDRLSASVIETTKRIILDSLGCALAATTLGDGCRETMAVMRRLGGQPESTILGVGAKVSPTNAAFANGALVHALNYDPIGSEIGHVGVVGLVAPLAIAEAVGGITGKEFIAASAVACETTARITSAIVQAGRRPSEKFLSGQLLNYFGAAAGAGRVLQLNAEQMRSAFGLALMQMAGSRQIVLSGDPPAKAIYGAFPNQAGVLAALLSKEGLGADCDFIGEPAGLYAMIYNGDGDVNVLMDQLGTHFLLEEVAFKPWPTSNNLHTFIEAASELHLSGIDVSKIVEVGILAHSQLRPWCEPLDLRRRPDNPAAAANSIPFCVAKSLVHGNVTLADFTFQGLKDAATLALGACTSYRLDDAVKGAVVNVKLDNGQRLEARVKTPLGDPARPVPMEQLIEKFRDCCRHTINPLAPDRVRELVALVENLEQLDEMRKFPLLTTGSIA